MNETVIPGPQDSFRPHNRGLSLGWRLALLTVLIISLVMGVVSVGQQLLNVEREQQLHQQLLQLSLVPLAARVEAAAEIGSIQWEIEQFHTAYMKKGFPTHEVLLLDAEKNQLFSTEGVQLGGEIGYLTATLPVVSELLNGGRGDLQILKSRAEYDKEVRREWLLWVLHFVITTVVVFLFLIVAIYFQVTKPVNRLIQGVKKMEMGYWRPVDLTGGAWEVRWLSWRFGNMVQEVQSAMNHLFEAEQKAQSLAAKNRNSSLREEDNLLFETSDAVMTPSDSHTYRELLAICEKLELATPDDSQTLQLAHRVWRQEALEANRIGIHGLKARLEDAALRLMEPEGYKNLDRGITELKQSWQLWADECRSVIHRLLEERGIPCAEVLYRVKHTAGVWAKMESKALNLEDIHDLFAFRIIVPTEIDCYVVLGALHQKYKPVVSRFKDYIAKPKGNGYRSLHTCVQAADSPVFEVQIRSVAMNRQAEQGNAAHWLYKKDGRIAGSKTMVLSWWQRCWGVEK